MENGYLVVQVFTANGFLPLEQAQVFVTTPDETLLYTVETTDRLGRTVILTMETPPKELSMSPSDEKVFTTCNVYISKQDYFSMVIRGVQIFSGELSVQNAVLSPLPSNFEGDTVRVVEITPQNL